MNRQQEYWELLRQLNQLPPELDGTVDRARARARRSRRGRRWGISLASLAGMCASFVIAVNALPTFALACGNIPILRELAAAVAFSPSLSEAVRHDYGSLSAWNISSPTSSRLWSFTGWRGRRRSATWPAP